jgi:hypothetical protein
VLHLLLVLIFGVVMVALGIALASYIPPLLG